MAATPWPLCYRPAHVLAVRARVSPRPSRWPSWPADSWPRAAADARRRRADVERHQPGRDSLVLARRGARQRRDARARDGQSGAPAGGRLRGRTVQGGGPRPGDAGGIPAARVVHLPSSARRSVVAGPGQGRRRRSRHARRAGDLRHAYRSGARRRGAAGVCRLRPAGAGDGHRRLRGPRREGQGGGLPGRAARPTCLARSARTTSRRGCARRRCAGSAPSA